MSDNETERAVYFTFHTRATLGVMVEDGITDAQVLAHLQAAVDGGEARFSDSTLYTAPTQRDVWKNLTVTGHTTGLPGHKARGTWDLIGGALKVILGGRLSEYRSAP